MTRSTKLWRCSLLASAVLALTACGGSDDSSSPTPGPDPTPEPKILSGNVARIGTLQNAVVCLDLNANNACDAGEPVSAKTGADGAYSVDVTQVSATDLAGAMLIAPMDSAVIDSASAGPATDNAYVMTRPAGTGGGINPLTTLVQKGIAGGMSEADARKNAAIQLALDEARIDNYQSDAVPDASHIQDSTRLMAIVVSEALRSGAILSVADQSAAVAASDGSLRSLTYSGPDNYRFRTNDFLAKPAGETLSLYKDSRAGKVGGVALTSQQLYGTAYLGPDGWTYCNDTVVHTQTQGNPSRSTYCGGEVSVGYNRQEPVANQAMADVLNALKADAANFSTPAEPTAALLGALGSAKFPAGSNVTRRTNMAVQQSIYINALANDGRPQAEATTLEQLITAKPVSNVKLPASGGTLTLGITSSELRNQRVAFGAATSPTTGEVQYYECDLSADQTSSFNCAAAGTGTYSISTISGVRVIRFANQLPSIMNHTRVYAEVDWGGANGKWIYQARETKPDVNSLSTNSARLNAAAWQGIKGQLGL
ncbi:MAG: hypothetical protein WBC18_00400 [Ottowia sp.]|uniref:hypothetical protein n=1 Tax=Ottowia sp. TaxID=1898956 RepID=UPI003C763352